MKRPQLSPYIIPQLRCAECGDEMRPKIDRQNNGKIVGAQVTFFCDKCESADSVFLQHANTIAAKYEPPVKAAPPVPSNALDAEKVGS